MSASIETQIDTIQQRLSDEESSDTEERAALYHELGDLFTDLVTGERSEHLEKAIDAYRKALSLWNKETQPHDWAKTMHNLGLVFRSRLQGDAEKNIRHAIEAYEACLDVFTQKAYPNDWADTHRHLAIAYHNRYAGDREVSLKHGLHHSLLALQVFTQASDPVNWAIMQQMLGYIHAAWVGEDKPAHIEQAIVAFRKSLEVFTKDQNPSLWTSSQYNLGQIYTARSKGSVNENIAHAVHAFESALEVYDRIAQPELWAMTKHALALAYSGVEGAERVDYLERAIDLLEEALQVYIPEEYPQDWIMVHNTLGIVYQERIYGDPRENVQRAVRAFHAALDGLEKDVDPDSWASIQHNLGNALSSRFLPNRKENLYAALEAYRLALQIRRPEETPVAWARTHYSIGQAHQDLMVEEDSENHFEAAVQSFEKALTVYTVSSHPIDWGHCQFTLGNAYSTRAAFVREAEAIPLLEKSIQAYERSLQTGSEVDMPSFWATVQINLGQAFAQTSQYALAILHFEKALTVLSPSTAPHETYICGRDLGDAAGELGEWSKAIQGYEVAIEATEQQRLWLRADQRKREELRTSIDAYTGMVQACLELGLVQKALYYSDRVKARSLTEFITVSRLLSQSLSKEFREQVDRLRRTLITEDIQSSTLQVSPQDRSKWEAAYSAYQSLLEEIQPNAFNVISSYEVWSKTALQPPDRQTAVLSFFISGSEMHAFLVHGTNKEKPSVHHILIDEIDAVLPSINLYTRSYADYRTTPSTSAPWRQKLSRSLDTFSRLFKLSDIVYRIPESIRRLVIVPHVFVHLIPLHACPIHNPQNPVGRCMSLADRFDAGITYAPSMDVFQRVAAHPSASYGHVLTIQNPGDNLIFSDLEVQTITPFVDQMFILDRDQGIHASLMNPIVTANYNVLHCACHGHFDPISPFESALELAPGKRLMLADAFQLPLNDYRLVTLSACESGLSDAEGISDEYIGFPHALLVAGAGALVTSLWAVGDLSTNLLMSAFYQSLHDACKKSDGKVPGGHIAEALQQAQLWLKNISVDRVVEIFDFWRLRAVTDGLALSAKARFELLDALEYERYRISALPEDTLPYTDPYYWAGFVPIGY